MSLNIKDMPIVGAAAAGFQFWWIIILIAVLLLLLIIILCCCLYCQRNKGDSYPVDEKERKNGNDPEKEIKDNDFQDYRRPESQPLRGSQGSLGSSAKLNSDDEASLNEYGDVDPGKFNEDGSFVGVYTNTADRKKGRNEY
jgi:receptor-type tyrosine-protein phosphatase zeta